MTGGCSYKRAEFYASSVITIGVNEEIAICRWLP